MITLNNREATEILNLYETVLGKFKFFQLLIKILFRQEADITRCYEYAGEHVTECRELKEKIFKLQEKFDELEEKYTSLSPSLEESNRNFTRTRPSEIVDKYREAYIKDSSELQ